MGMRHGTPSDARLWAAVLPRRAAMSDELCFLTVAEASRLIKARKLSPLELTRAHLARIEALQPQLDAFITVTADLALKQARAAEREIGRNAHRGPLHGIPVALKDIFD